MSDVELDGSAAFPFRLRLLEKAKEANDLWRRDVDDDRRDLKQIREEVATLSTAVDNLRKTLLKFAFTIAGSAVVFALTVLISTGKIGGG